MKNIYDWKHALPEETEAFHEKIREVVRSLPEERTGHWAPKKRYLPVLVAAVFILSSATVFAALKWNDQAAHQFGTDEQLQKNLTEEGYSRQDEQSVTDNGITITLEQTVQDENLIYLLFKVTSDNLELTENNGMGYEMKASNGSGFFTSASSGFVNEFEQPELSNSREYEVWITKNRTYDFKEAVLSLSFNTLEGYKGKAGPVEELVKGQWNFDIDLSANASVEIDMDKTVTLEGCDVKIHKIKISPLSYIIYFDNDDVKALQEAKDIHPEVLDITYPLILSGVKYKDATVMQGDAGLMSEGLDEGFDKESGDFIIIGRFSEAINVDQVQEIVFNDKETGVSIR